MKYIVACFSTGPLLHFWGSCCLNCNLFNYMLLWFFPLALIWFFTTYASCLGYPQCLGQSRCYDQWPMHFCKALSWKSVWIKASAKWINVNVSLAVTACKQQTHLAFLRRLKYCRHSRLWECGRSRVLYLGGVVASPSSCSSELSSSELSSDSLKTWEKLPSLLRLINERRRGIPVSRRGLGGVLLLYSSRTSEGTETVRILYSLVGGESRYKGNGEINWLSPN